MNCNPLLILCKEFSLQRVVSYMHEIGGGTVSQNNLHSALRILSKKTNHFYDKFKNVHHGLMLTDHTLAMYSSINTQVYCMQYKKCHISLFIDNEDFVAGNCRVIEFASQIARQKHCFFVGVLADNEVEGNENFTIQLAANHQLVTVRNGAAIVTILDDDMESSTTPENDGPIFVSTTSAQPGISSTSLGISISAVATFFLTVILYTVALLVVCVLCRCSRSTNKR